MVVHADLLIDAPAAETYSLATSNNGHISIKEHGATMTKAFSYGDTNLTVAIALQLARNGTCGRLAKSAFKRVKNSQKRVKNIVDTEKVVYGINTGFGPLCQSIISKKDTILLQENILRSHSVGVGDPIALEIAKLMLILKVQSLSYGFSGVSIETLERILWHIDSNVIPLVPEQGSVGASGDLAPLAHLFLPLIGLGQVFVDGRFQDTRAVLKKFSIKPLTLGPKEGLALINGTQFITAHAIKVVERLHNCLECADIIGALSLEALLGSVKPFDKQMHDLRPFAGAKLVATRLRNLLEGSLLLVSHKNCDRVQDPYSLRCMPQVHGASRDAWLHLKQQLDIEMNSVTDNPIILENGEAISGGNFHGQSLALPLDYVAMAASELGNISDRRIYLLLEGKSGLPPLLMKNTGINSGFMIPQYTSAALASENKSLCFPASVDSIPTSLGQEDHVSMGPISARKALRIIDNLENILAVELLCAAQAFDYRRPLKSSRILESVHQLIRDHISHAENDRVFADDLKLARKLIASGKIWETAGKTAQKLKIDWGILP